MSSNKDRGIDWGTIVVSIVLIIYGWVISIFVRKTTGVVFKAPVDDIGTDMFSGYVRSNTHSVTNSISAEFEEKCIRDPLKYKNDADIPKVLKDYKDLLLGHILDPEGIHTPSLNINGEENPDYYRYLRNQKRALDKVGKDTEWLSKEMARVTSGKKALELESEFGEHLFGMGLPEDIVVCALTYERLESHTPDNWEALVASVNSILETNEDCSEFIIEFLNMVSDPTYYTVGSIDDYVTLREYGVTSYLSLPCAKREITMQQAVSAAELTDRGYTDEDALIKVLEVSKESYEKEALVDLYKSQI